MAVRGGNNQDSAADFLPEARSYHALYCAARTCRGCDLYKNATQTVFGEGASGARLMLVGEQPGDEEDLAGHPFVGPSGKVLARAIRDSGLSLEDIYITNAVKHFRFVYSGKRRLHKKPSAVEIAACKPWLDAEIDLIKPKAVLCLGATASQSVLGAGFSLMKHLGQWQEAGMLGVLAIYHPSAALRAPTHEDRQKVYDALVDALRKGKEKTA